jgi:hypothetical protein
MLPDLLWEPFGQGGINLVESRLWNSNTEACPLVLVYDPSKTTVHRTLFVSVPIAVRLHAPFGTRCKIGHMEKIETFVPAGFIPITNKFGRTRAA